MKLINTSTKNVYRVAELPEGATNGPVTDAIKAYLKGAGRKATVTVKRGRVNRKAFYAEIVTKGA